MSETKQHWSMGGDDTGDITSWENFRKFKAEVDEELEGVHLVKDGGNNARKHSKYWFLSSSGYCGREHGLL